MFYDAAQKKAARANLSKRKEGKRERGTKHDKKGATRTAHREENCDFFSAIRYFAGACSFERSNRTNAGMAMKQQQ